ncbi:MAG: DUF4340 domain-containing protein [Deltaproteobacteria bacterium]|nr:DUF4340 domain-containing protein [Deltaproteobacteria bacterium]
MLEKRALISLGLLVVVAGAVIYTRTRPDPHVRAGEQKLAGIPELKAQDIDELAITEPEKPTITLKKEGNEWKLVQPIVDRADKKSVESALSSLEKAKFKDVIAESPASHEKLNVKDDQVLKILPKKGGKVLATIQIGTTGNVRLGGTQVFSVSDLSRYAFSHEPKMWRDREILRFEASQVDSIELSHEGGAKLALKRESPPPPVDEKKDGENKASPQPVPPTPPSGDRWILAQGKEAIGGPIDESLPGQVASVLGHLDASDFADDAKPEQVGLDKPRITVAVFSKDGAKKQLALGSEQGDEVHISSPGSPRIWKVRKSTVDALLKSPMEWRDKTLAKIDEEDMASIEIVKGTDKVKLERTGDKAWKVAVPSDLGELDTFKVQSLAASFNHLKAIQIVEGADASKTGFKKPTGKITIKKKDGASVTVTVGAIENGNYFITSNTRPEVFTLSEFSVNRFLKASTDLKKSASSHEDPHPAMGM